MLELIMVKKDFEEVFNEASKIVVITGAGVSTSGGLPDFKSLDSNWNYDVDRNELFSLPYFLQEPVKFWKAYREVYGSALEAKPTLFHETLVKLEEYKKISIVTQNVDGLHTIAGSSEVFEAHGSRLRLICLPHMRLGCGRVYSSDGVFSFSEVPQCICGQILKPDISLFFEGVNFMSEAREAIKNCDLLIVSGTSLRVAPVNELPWIAEFARPTIPSVLVNDEPIDGEYTFTFEFRDSSDNFAKLMLKYSTIKS